jgi:hypothetical protein
MNKLKINPIFSVLNYLVLFSCLNTYSFSQSKKEQIQILGSRLDSLKTIQSNEKQSFEKRKNELESSKTLSHQKTAELLKTLSNKKENLQNQIQENQKLDQEILSLQSEFKSIEDSIQAIIDNRPIEFLDRSIFDKTEEEMIELINITSVDLGEEFKAWNGYSFVEFNKDPIKSITGIQLFQLGGKKYCTAILEVFNQNTFVGAAGTSFIVLFEENNGFWRLSKKINTYFGGQMGNPSSFEQFSLMGDKTLALELSNFSQGQGITNQYRMIYALINKEFVLVYQGDKHWDELGRTGSSANASDAIVTFMKSNSKFFDLQVKVREEGKKVKTTILKFNESTMKYE